MQKKRTYKNSKKLEKQKVVSTLLAALFLWTTTAPLALAQQDVDRVVNEKVPAPAKPKSVRRGSRNISKFEPKSIKSEEPDDIEVRLARIFPEPLTPMSSTDEDDENFKEKRKQERMDNKKVAKALALYKGKNNAEDFSDILKFIKDNPNSRWLASLELNLGIRRYEAGYFSEALSLWESAWKRSKDKKGRRQREVADRAIAELLSLNGKLGRKEKMESLLSQIKGRVLTGTMESKVEDARDGLWLMKNRPDIAFKCGPLSINSLVYLDKEILGRDPFVEQMKSTSQGTNLAQIHSLADKCGLKLQMAKRETGAPFIVPSVLHWKVDHFASITNKAKGRFQIKDPTFDRGGNLWVTAQALEAETDGYFLVPQGPLPKGWTSITEEEASKVWGKGGSATGDPSKSPGTPKECVGPDCCGKGGMAKASAFSMNATLNIMDTPLSYQTPYGPSMEFLVNYNHLEAGQPATFTFSNLGPNWSLNWISYLTLDASGNATVMVRGGGSEYYPFTQPNNITNPYPRHLISQAVLRPAELGSKSYIRLLPDGSSELFNQVDGTGRIFMTEVIDPHGNSVKLQYDSNFRLTTITDPLNQASTISYVSDLVDNDGFYKISQISDPFSRVASFEYDPSITYLTKITDTINISSAFMYDSSSAFISLMSTPYGDTSFHQYLTLTTSEKGRGLRFGFPDGTQAVIENWLRHIVKTFFWDRNAMSLYPSDPGNLDYTHCKTTKFMVEPGTNVEAPVIAWIKPALEGQITNTYEGQTGSDDLIYIGNSNKPIKVERILDDLSVQSYNYKYNDAGKVTESIDPLGRKFEYEYAANGIDLLEVRQTKDSNNDLLGKWIFNNSVHLPNISLDGSGQRTSIEYNNRGQITSSTDQDNKVTTMSYDVDGYLEEIDGPLPGDKDVTSFAYDGYGRLYTITDSEGYVVTYSYDDADRITQITYPDGTNDKYKYSRLDNVLSKDRIGRWTERSFDNMGQLAFERDPLGRKTQYFWCDCGSLSKLVDPKGNTTIWNHDLQGRVTEKVFEDDTSVDYVYENTTSRLKSRTDELNQVTNYSYKLDDTLSQISYTNAVNPTSTVTMTYDADYPRTKTIENGWGKYTYTYNSYITDPFNPIADVTMAGTNTTGDKINVTIFNSNLLGGKHNVQYTVQAGDTSSTILATSVKNAINADSSLSAQDIDASSSGAIVSINAPLQKAVVTIASSTNGIVTETVGGTITTNDTVSITAKDIALPNGEKSVTHTVVGGDTLTTIATGLKNLINADTDMTAAGITATSASAVVSIASTSANATTYAESVSSGATASITQAGGPTETASKSINTGGGRLQKVENDVISNSDITYEYDALGRVTNRSINGSTNSIDWTYDAMSRVLSEKNALGTFQYNYVEDTPGSSKGVSRLASINYPNGQVTKYSWFGNDEDQRLQQISNLKPSGATLSQFSYRYDPEGQITQWQQIQNNSSHNFHLSYDQAGQLKSARAAGGSFTPAFLKQHHYAYDSASNRTAVQKSTVTKARIGGTVTANDIVTITVADPGLTGGSQAVNYTVQAGDTLAIIASSLAANITADASLQSLGVDASSNGAVINIKSTSRDVTTYSQSTSGGATATVTLGETGNFVESVVIAGSKTTGDVLTIDVYDSALSGGSQSVSYTVLAGDTLTTIATGLKNAINNDTNLSNLGVSATSAGTVISIRSTSVNATTYSQSKSSGATITIALSVNQNSDKTIVIGGTSTIGNSVTVTVYDKDLTGGSLSKVYYVQWNDTLTTIASGVASAINADTNLQAIGVSATSSGTVVTVQSDSINPTSYRAFSNTNAGVIVNTDVPVNGVQTAVIGGTKTTNDVLTITAFDSGLAGGSKAVNYTVLAGDTLNTIASGLATAINNDTALAAQGISATVNSTVVNIKSVSVNATSYTQSLSGGATETITLAPSTGVTKFVHNDVNELTSLSAGGAVHFSGNANKALDSATINSNDANFEWSKKFSGDEVLSTGNNNIPVAVTDGASNTKTSNHQVLVSSGSSATLTYDGNGNMTSDGTNTYAWDAENRLIKITYPGTNNFSDFTYDAFDRNTKIVETTGGTVTSTKQFVWCSGYRCEERSASSSVAALFFSDGQTVNSSNRFYSSDHLGSIREVTNDSGSITVQISYSPYGKQIHMQGTLDTDFTFSSFYYHSRSTLSLAVYRAYMASLAQWINRDPIEEAGGLNLYSYAENEPIGLVDPTGLNPARGRLLNRALSRRRSNASSQNANEPGWKGPKRGKYKDPTPADAKKKPKKNTKKKKRRKPRMRDFKPCNKKGKNANDKQCCDMMRNLCKALCKCRRKSGQYVPPDCENKCDLIWRKCKNERNSFPGDQWRNLFAK